jgi:hypothetical protein
MHSIICQIRLTCRCYYGRVIRYLSILFVVSFVLHAVWEYAHLPLYTGYDGLFGGYPVWLVATLGDVLYTLGAVLVLWLIKLDKNYAALTVAGFCVAVFVEYKAMLLHRWAYAAAMPTVLGLGLSPLLQMTLLLPLSVYISSRFIKRKTALGDPRGRHYLKRT